jgi:hypothetical protein
MSEIILFIGLPGSGKTHVSGRMCSEIFDDIIDLDLLPQQIEVDSILGICDVNFCDDKILSNAVAFFKDKYPHSRVKKHYFENAPDKCRANVVHRNDGRNVEGTIKRFEKIYNPPQGFHEVWGHVKGKEDKKGD